MVFFTKSHFEEVAQCFKSVKPVIRGTHEKPVTSYMEDSARLAQWQITCEKFAGRFEVSNSRFDRGKFLKACGYQKE